MDNNACASSLQCFIGQVADYHRQCNFHHSGPIVFTIKMAAFALPAYSFEEVADCIKTLAGSGTLTIIKEEPLSFTIKAQYWQT